MVSLAVAGCATAPPPPPPPPFLAFNLYNNPAEQLPVPEDDEAAIRLRAAEAGYPLDAEGLFSNLLRLFATRARRADLPGFNEVWVEKDFDRSWINVGSSESIDRDAYLAMAAPKIRSRIRFRQTLFDRAGTDAALAQLVDAYDDDLGVCMMLYEHQSDWFVVGMEDSANEAAIRAVIPANLLPVIRFERGTCPILV